MPTTRRRIQPPASGVAPRSDAGTDTRTDTRLGHIIRLLAGHATVVVSGTKIAQEIGASRSAVWRFVEQLRALGVEIAGHPTTGYQLKRVPDLLLPEVLAPMLKGTLFAACVHHYFRTGSTNAEALAAAAAGEPEGSVFFAEEQTSGRGRGGRTWHSEKSAGIYVSVLLRPAMAPAEVLVLTLAAGLAARSAIQQVTGVDADLRWPNDLLISGKKFCGILAEMHAEATRVRYVVVGIGLNVNHERLPAELRAAATSLRLATGRAWSRVELAAALLRALDREYRALVADPAATRESVLRRFVEGSSSARGKAVRVEENGGFEGITDGLDAHGFLRVRTEQGWRTVLSGGVRELE